MEDGVAELTMTINGGVLVWSAALQRKNPPPVTFDHPDMNDG